MIRRGFSGRAVVVHNVADMRAIEKRPLWARGPRVVGRCAGGVRARRDPAGFSVGCRLYPARNGFRPGAVHPHEGAGIDFKFITFVTRVAPPREG